MSQAIEEMYRVARNKAYDIFFSYLYVKHRKEHWRYMRDELPFFHSMRALRARPEIAADPEAVRLIDAAVEARKMWMAVTKGAKK